MSILKGKRNGVLGGWLAIGLLLGGGCGESESTVQASGRLLQDGGPLAISDRGGVVMVFHEFTNNRLGEQSYAASVDRTGSYQVELPPGRYRVAVQLMDPYSQHRDQLRGAFRQMNSPLMVEVEQTQSDLDIELARS